MPPGMVQSGMFPPGMMPPGMMQPGMMHPGMMQAMQFAQLGPGGMPSGQMPQNPANPLQGMHGVPSAQMEYLQRQMQAMGMQRPQGMGQQAFPGQQMPGIVLYLLLMLSACCRCDLRYCPEKPNLSAFHWMLERTDVSKTPAPGQAT